MLDQKPLGMLRRSAHCQLKQQRQMRLSTVLSIVTVTICLSPAFLYGATYYVAKSGTDARSCSQTRSASMPKRTIAAGIKCLASGDTLIIGAGTYAEGINDTIPAGKSTSLKTTVRSATGATVTLLPTSGVGPGSLHGVYITRSNIIIDRLVIDGGGRIALPFRWNGTNSGNVLQNSIVRNGSSACIIIQGNVTNAAVINNKIHSCTSHGIYPWNSGHRIERNEIYGMKGMGVHLYKAAGGVSNNIIRGNYIHHNGSRGILLGSGNNNVADHNTIVANGFSGKAGGLGVSAGAGGTNNQAYNNTIQDNYQCINIASGYRNSKVQNNLCLSNKFNVITNSGTGTILTNNTMTPDGRIATTVSSSSTESTLESVDPAPSAPANLQAGD